MQKWFSELQKLFRKMFQLKLEGFEFPCVCHDISCHKESFQKPITPCHDYLPFFLPSLLVIHVRVYLIHHDFPHIYLSELHTFFRIFSSYFSLWIKPFSFLSMTTLLCYPYHRNCLTMRSFIYSPAAHYVQLVLTDVGFLKAHFSTSLAPLTSAPYLE